MPILSQGHFCASFSDSEEEHKKPGREQSLDRWAELAKRVFHNMEQHAHYINQGNYLGGGLIGFQGQGSGISQQMVSNCIVHHYFSLGFILLLLLLVLLLLLSFTIIVIIFYSVSIIKLFLSLSGVLPLILSPIPLWWDVGPGCMSVCMVLSCQLGLSNDTLPH